MRSFVEEKQAFREIEQLLLRDQRFDTVQPKTFVIDNLCWQHFRSYHGVAGRADRRGDAEDTSAGLDR